MRMKIIPFPRLLLLATLLCAGRLGHAQDLDTVRQMPLTGTATDQSTRVTITLGDNDDPANRIMTGTVDSSGNFNVPIKLFPGNNTIDVQGDTNDEQHTVTINVQAPSIRVKLQWAGAHQDYDLYVNNVCYYNKNTDGGTLDRDWIGNGDSDQPPAIENITFPQADAGLYHVFVNYYAAHTQDANGNPVTDPDTGETVPDPQETTVTVYVNDQIVYTATNTLSEPEQGIDDGKGTWAVCTLAVHSGTESGGFQVDDQGFRDIVPQGTKLDRIDPRTSFSIDSLDTSIEPSDDGIIYFPVGKSIQFNASGTINLGSDNEQDGIDIIGNFQSDSSSVADVDDLGVVTGLTPGVATISAQGDGDDDDDNASPNAVHPNADPAGNNSKKVGPTAVTFGKNGTSNGFDPGPKPPWLMVPLNGSNAADNTTINPSTAKIGLDLFGQSNVTLPQQGQTLTGSPISVTVQGKTAGDGAYIKAKLISSTGGLSDNEVGEMVASVKPRVPRTVVVHRVILPGQAPLGNIPSNNDIQTYLNNTVYGPQCNVYWTVTSSDVTVNYDVDKDNILLVNPTANNLSGEEQLVNNQRAADDQANHTAAANVHIYLVPSVETKPALTPPIAGFTHSAFNIASIGVAGGSAGFIEFAIAHELGHMAINGSLRDVTNNPNVTNPQDRDPQPSGTGVDPKTRLMYHDNNTGTNYPTFINKTEWNKINHVGP